MVESDSLRFRKSTFHFNWCVIRSTCPFFVHLTGVSRSTERTYLYIPELNIALDAGNAKKNVRPDYILCTHSHDDHCHSLPYLAQMIDVQDAAVIYCPAQALPFLDSLITSAV
jgi:glyoxylase-like metal-dependent hydrolase (beta-lactamase superfamily II)